MCCADVVYVDPKDNTCYFGRVGRSATALLVENLPEVLARRQLIGRWQELWRFEQRIAGGPELYAFGVLFVVGRVGGSAHRLGYSRRQQAVFAVSEWLYLGALGHQVGRGDHPVEVVHGDGRWVAAPG